MPTTETTDTASTTGKRAVIYARVSTAMQADTDITEDGFSIGAQRDACLHAAERLNAYVVEEYVDRGESARSAARPKLQEMLRRLKTKRDIDYVIVHKVDRLARSREDDVNIVLAIRQAGAQLVSATENIDETPSGKLLHGIMATIAEFYSQNLATEVQKGMRQKAKLGGTPGRAPIGYRNIIERIDGKTVRTVEIDEERAAHVRWAFEAYATGDYLIRELTEALKTRGLTTIPTGKVGGRPLSVSGVELMLANPYYIGIVTYEGVQYPGRHRPLIDPELWDRVQALKQARRVSKEKPYEHPHYLKGTLFCGQCGARIGVTKIKNRHGQTFDYFYCIGRQKRRDCDQKYVPMSRVEARVEDLWQDIHLPEAKVEAIRRTVLRFAQNQHETQRHELQKQTELKSRLDDERSKLMTAYYAGAIPIDVLKREQERLGSQMRACQAILDGANEELGAIEAGLDNVLQLIGDAHRLYTVADRTIRRQLNQAVFHKIYVEADEVSGFSLRSPFQQLLDPTLERDASEPEADESPRYLRADARVLPAEIQASLREIFEHESRATDGRPADDARPNSTPAYRAQGSNVLTLVPPTGFEPV